MRIQNPLFQIPHAFVYKWELNNKNTRTQEGNIFFYLLLFIFYLFVYFFLAPTNGAKI